MRRSDDVATSLMRAFVRHRAGFQVSADVLAWTAAVLITTALRDAVRSGSIPLGLVLATVVTAAILQPLVGIVSGLYLGRWRFGSFEEVAAVASSAVVTASGLVA